MANDTLSEAHETGAVAWHCVYPTRGHFTFKEHEAEQARADGADVRAMVYADPTEQEELRMLRERLGPRGLEVVTINGVGHYVNNAVRSEIDRLREDTLDDIVVLRSDRENLAKRVAELVTAIRDASELLTERRHGNPARSPGHNARLVLEGALAGTTPAVTSKEG